MMEPTADYSLPSDPGAPSVPDLELLYFDSGVIVVEP